ncbi:MAG: ATP-binding protein [Candidatus Sulfotelmatobacter sp.]|jgi:signal transduction histidine kinase
MFPHWTQARALMDMPASIFSVVGAPANSLDFSMARYALPIAFVALVVMIIVWRLQRLEWERVCEALKQATELRQRLEVERNQAQEEVYRRLYEDSELDKEKFQFQAQLAEYEKYSTLAQLALGAAHGINNPLLGILSHLELELKSASDPDLRWEIEQCIAGTKRISATLRGLVNYARPGPLVLSNLSLHRLVTDTLGFLEGQPALRGKRAENQVPEDLPHILVDSNQLSQVLMNLLINAAEATPDGGLITVSAKKLTFVDSIEICVSDTGCGIPPDILPHVFEPFFTTKAGKGTGLGLSISATYVRRNKGEIRIDSVLQRGTTVTITLPIRQEETHQVREQSEIVV